MFGLLFGAGKIDAYRAEVIHTYLGAYHRTHATLGFDSVLRTIEANPNVANFRDVGRVKAFRVPGDLDDFEFMIPILDVPSAKPIISVFGQGTYRGFQINVSLETGKYLLFMKEPTRRASSLCDLFQIKYDAGRVS